MIILLTNYYCKYKVNFKIQIIPVFIYSNNNDSIFFMKEKLDFASMNKVDLPNIRDKVLDTLSTIREESQDKRLGYVSGIITSDGAAQIDRNLGILEDHTNRLRTLYPFPIFSATSIFDKRILDDLFEMSLNPVARETSFYQFWREILKLGHVTDVFMTPRWERSKGALDELLTAYQGRMTVHFIDQNSKVLDLRITQ